MKEFLSNKSLLIKISPILLILLAFSIRIYGINWDQGHALHPDERMIAMVAGQISLDNLDPDFYNYGSLPIYILKLSSFVTSSIDGVIKHIPTTASSYSGFPNILLVGRALSAFFDTLTVLIVFLIGKRIKGKNFGFLAGFIYAISVFPIQNAHFYIVDPQMTFWMTLTLFLAIKHAKEPKPQHFLLLGLTSGLAAATKFTGVLTLSIPFLLITVNLVREFKKKPMLKWAVTQIVNVFATLSSAIIVFFITQPFVLINIKKYWEQVSFQLRMNSDPTVFPYTIQFINTPAYIHPLQGIIVWGLGLPLGILAILGVVYMARHLFTKRNIFLFIILGFALIFFTILGRSSVKFMRYYLPLYPILALSTAYLLNGFNKYLAPHSKLRLAYASIVAICVLIWPMSFMHIYTKPNPRIKATDWINSTFPVGTAIATEHWDDIIPLENPNGYKIQQIEVYNPESEAKWTKINNILEESDYFIISSERVYKSILNWPEKYPKTIIFYNDLLAGNSNFKLYKTFSNYPTIPVIGIEIPDGDSPESMTIFDHPTVFIFKKENV